MEVFPAFFDMIGARVVVFGTGQDAARKIRLLRRTEAEIIVLGSPGSDWPDEEFSDLVCRPLREAETALPGARFVIIAEDDKAARERAIALARAHHLPVNVVDHRSLSDFIVPSLVDRGKLVVAVSTSGAAPVLGQRIRTRIENSLPAAMREILDFAASIRETVQTRYRDARDRRAFWGRFADALPTYAAGDAFDSSQANALLEAAFSHAPPHTQIDVSILSIAEIGSTDALTLGAFRVMQDCDLAVIEPGVGASWLDLIRRDAERFLSEPSRLSDTVVAHLRERKAPLSVLVLSQQASSRLAVEQACHGLDVRVRSLR